MEIVRQGFRHLTKIHHPDHRGTNEAQRRLNEARDCLTRLRENLTEDPPENAVWIQAPLERQVKVSRAAFAEKVSDDDVPF